MPEKMIQSKNSKIILSAAIVVVLVALVALVLLIGARGKFGPAVSDNTTTVMVNGELKEASPTTTMTPASTSDSGSTSGHSTEHDVTSPTNTASTIEEQSLGSKGSTELFLPSTMFPEDDEVTVPIRADAQHVPYCEFPQQTKKSCPTGISRQPASRSDDFFQIFDSQPNLKLSTLVRPVEYAMNLSIIDKNQHLLSGSLDLLMEVLKESNYIVLHAGRQIRFIQEDQVSAWVCADEELICATSITRLVDKQLLIISLDRKLRAGSVIRLKIGKFESEVPSNPGLILQVPSKWERERPWIIGSFNYDNGSRLIYPGVDEPEVVAAFELCVRHPKDTIARSNMPKKSGIADESDNRSTNTCFQVSPMISAKHFTFLLFDNMKTISLIGSNSTVAPVEDGISVEVFVGKHLQAEHCQWILEETHKALNEMALLTSVAYPLGKLTIISAPIPVDGTHNLGLIQLKETWIEYPKYFFPHTLLTSQIVHQWVSNMVTTCDKCIQEGLATYLEWIISSEFVIDGQTSNITKRFTEARNRLLHSENTMKSAALFSVDSLKPTSNQCAERVAVVLYMLEKVYSRETISDFLALTISRFSWHTCVPTKVLSDVFLEATKSTDAQRVFDSFMRSTGSLGYPLVRIHLHPNTSLVISQHSADDFNRMYSVPLEIVDDSHRRSSLVLNSTQFVGHRPAAYVFAEPNSYARHVYNVENYEKLADCMNGDSNKCPAVSPDALTSTFSDLCWALLSNKLEEVDKALQWRSLFDKLVEQKNAVHGDCACCMEKRSTAKAQVY